MMLGPAESLLKCRRIYGFGFGCARETDEVGYEHGSGRTYHLVSGGARDPWFQDANLRALSARTCPGPDQAFLQRLIDYGIATGYLRARSVQRTSG